MAEIGADFLPILAAKELGAAGHQGFHQPDAVRPGAAACLGDLAFRLCPVMSARFHQVDVQVAAAGIHIRVAGVALLGALVVGLDAADLRAFILGKAQNGIHGLADKTHLLSVFWKKAAYIRTCVPFLCTYVRSDGRYALLETSFSVKGFPGEKSFCQPSQVCMGSFSSGSMPLKPHTRRPAALSWLLLCAMW